MRRRFFLIYNPAAGTARGAFVADVERRLLAAGASVQRGCAATAEAACAEATAAARSGAFDAIVSAGGDGTVRQAAIATLGTECAVGAIMIGTGNVLAHELDLPRTAPEIAQMLLDGPTVPVELSRANGSPFLLMAGVGFDGRIIGHLNQSLKQRFAKAAYVPAALRALSAPLDVLNVEIDGTPHACTWAVVTSAERYGGHFRLTSAVSLREPGLAVLLFRARRRSDLVAHCIALARGRLDLRAALDADWVSIIPCRQVVVTSAREVPVQIDGDEFGVTPLTVTHDGGSVQMIVADASARS
jgi:diacylglycerol kinase (ATP)